MSQSVLPHPLGVCVGVFLVTLGAVLSPSAGGYGFITWAWHPALALLGLWVLLPGAVQTLSPCPASWLPASYEGRRAAHGALAAAGACALLAGWGVAWWSHHVRGHAHIPGWHKPLVKQAHVCGGLAVLLGLVAQACVGAARHYPSLRSCCCARRVLSAHSDAGLPLWLSALAVSCLGLWLPFGAAAPAVGAALIALAAVGGGAVVATHRRTAASGGGDGAQPGGATGTSAAADAAAACAGGASGGGGRSDSGAVSD